MSLATHQEPDAGDQPRGPLGRWVETASEILALFGGLVLVGLTVFTVFSVVGAAAFNSPILGDAEVTEIATAVAVFAFLPWCQLRGKNVVVDFFTARISPRARNLMDGTNDLVFTLVMGVMTWRLAAGALDAWNHGEISMMLGIPQWWGYLGGMAGMSLLTLVCAYTAFLRFRKARG